MIISPIDTRTDLSELDMIAKKAFGNSSDAALEKWFSFEEMARSITEKRGVCLKAVDEDRIIGFLYAQEENQINGAEGKEKWVIVIAAVDTEMKGRGIGSAMLQEIEKVAREKNVIKMFVYTNKEDEKVIHFYKKNGYEDAGYIKDYQYGTNNSAIFLLKYLR